MSSVSKISKYCCTCQYLGEKAALKESFLKYDNASHVCRIGTRVKGNVNPTMTSACPKWQERKN